MMNLFQQQADLELFAREQQRQTDLEIEIEDKAEELRKEWLTENYFAGLNDAVVSNSHLLWALLECNLDELADARTDLLNAIEKYADERRDFMNEAEDYCNALYGNEPKRNAYQQAMYDSGHKESDFL